jgi:hypothetical protein
MRKVKTLELSKSNPHLRRLVLSGVLLRPALVGRVMVSGDGFKLHIRCSDQDGVDTKNGNEDKNENKQTAKSSPPALLPRRSSRGGMVTKNPRDGFYFDTSGGRTQDVFDLRRGRAWRI